MITTLTPNPSLDRTVSLPGELIRGGVNRLTGVTIEPGGKGLNVARVLVGAGQTVTAVLPASTHDPLLRVLGAVAADARTRITRYPSPTGGTRERDHLSGDRHDHLLRRDDHDRPVGLHPHR